ncbi:unnamed protein product [Rotaria sordida]|uniref:DNA-directed RNA polymerase n=1 Tax=Rotaria sordida TaxID=392033 RepID=A0A819WZA6_9BILA|nr:unnamed protein product [Rotaria sordida]
MKLNPPSSTKIEVTTKNLLTIRQQLIKDFERRAFKTKSLYFVLQSKKLNDNDESIDNDEVEMLTKMMSSQMYLTRLDLLKDLEKIWTNEKEVVAIYLAILPVLPSKFRSVLSFNDQIFENPKTNRSSLTNTLRGITNEEKLNNLWLKIQITVNSIFDSSLDNRSDARVGKGIRQIIEKKEGLFRMYMMGKRVNYAGRSVISPDPFIAIYQVGIPEIFTKKLTYPQLVTRDNVDELRQLILNGSDVHPGGNFVELEDETIRRLLPNNLSQRTACYRHLRTGDYVLVNRQPTLHRPSIQAHMGNFLLHYAQCKSYNADFDGDEMNIHLPQNELTRTEAAELMITYQDFLVSKDGTPLTGFIQDHVVAGRTLTMRDGFFEKSDYQQLIISTILLYIQPVNQASLNLDSKSKFSMKSYPSKSNATNIDLMANTDVIIRHGHLLSGLIDKAHCGSTLASLLHCYYQLYGKRCAADLVTAFSK